MAKCRIQNLSPSCAYNASGVDVVMFLDFEDFVGFTFRGLASYETLYVESVNREGNFITINLPDFPAQYTGTHQRGVYGHSLEAFVPELSAEILQSLHLATKRPQVVIFRTRAGRYFAFGHEAGAKVTYSAQTSENTGALLSVTSGSQFPLFEVAPTAMAESALPSTYLPLFDDSAVCEITGSTDRMTGFLQATLAIRISTVSGEPLDRDGRPVSQSGKDIAAYLLNGRTPPAGYDIIGRFAPKALVTGEPSIQYAPDVCAEGVIAGWILETGFWDNSAYWLDDGIWNF